MPGGPKDCPTALPLRRFEVRLPMRAASCAPRCAASREVRCSAKCCMRTTCRALGSPLPARPRLFSAGPPVCLRSPSTPPFDGASSFRELSASSRVLRPAPCPPASRPAGASHGVHVPHRGISFRRPPFRGESRPRGLVPSPAFLTPSTVCSARNLRGFVSPRSHVQGLPSRGLSLSAEPYGVSPAVSCPPAVGREAPLTSASVLVFRALLPAVSAVPTVVV